MATGVLSGCQARAARAMLMWSVRQLAQASGISDSSIRRIESGFGVPENVTIGLVMRLREFYESKGFVFTSTDDWPTVQWRKKERRRRGTFDRHGPGSIETSAEDRPSLLRM